MASSSLKNKRKVSIVRRDEREVVDDEYDHLHSAKELKPLTYYIEDKPKLIFEAFKILKEKRLRAMLPNSLKKYRTDQLEDLCLRELKNLDSITIYEVLKGNYVPPPPPSQEETCPSPISDNPLEDDEDDLPKPKDIRKISNYLKKSIDKKSSSKKHKKKRKHEKAAEGDSDENEEVVSKKLKKDKKNKKKKAKNKEKEKEIKSKMKKKKKKEKEKLKAQQEGQVGKGTGQTLMELLELEYRAKAIKALLKTQGVETKKLEGSAFDDGDNSSQNQTTQESEENLQSSQEKLQKSPSPSNKSVHSNSPSPSNDKEEEEKPSSPVSDGEDSISDKSITSSTKQENQNISPNIDKNIPVKEIDLGSPFSPNYDLNSPEPEESPLNIFDSPLNTDHTPERKDLTGSENEEEDDKETEEKEKSVSPKRPKQRRNWSNPISSRIEEEIEDSEPENIPKELEEGEVDSNAPSSLDNPSPYKNLVLNDDEEDDDDDYMAIYKKSPKVESISSEGFSVTFDEQINNSSPLHLPDFNTNTDSKHSIKDKDEEELEEGEDREENEENSSLKNLPSVGSASPISSEADEELKSNDLKNDDDDEERAQSLSPIEDDDDDDGEKELVTEYPPPPPPEEGPQPNPNPNEDQEEHEYNPVTWYERWYNSKKIQKVVKSSKMVNRARKKILNKKEEKAPVILENEEEVSNVPIVGSIEEYEKIFGKKVPPPVKPEVDEESKKNSSADEINKKTEEEEEEEKEEEEEDDDLWGDIIGGGNTSD